MRFFNTAGPMIPEKHYHVPPLERLDRGELLSLIDDWKYFVLHAPRQTGKTSALLALVEELNAGGGLNVAKLLAAFQEFFREHSEHWVQRFQYREAGPQLLLQAFLQRIVNRGGLIHREYGLGRMRTDLLLVWPAAPPGAARKTVIECKVVHPQRGLEATIREGLAQTRAYLQRCSAAEGHLVVFDRRPERTWEDKLFRRAETSAGTRVTVWGM